MWLTATCSLTLCLASTSCVLGVGVHFHSQPAHKPGGCCEIQQALLGESAAMLDRSTVGQLNAKMSFLIGCMSVVSELFCVGEYSFDTMLYLECTSNHLETRHQWKFCACMSHRKKRPLNQLGAGKEKNGPWHINLKEYVSFAL